MMETQKFYKNTRSIFHAGKNLPIGYRFHPTDEELVFHYLRPKVFGTPLPASVIPHFDVFSIVPWDLPGDVKEKRYFFSKCDQGNLDKSCKWKHAGKSKKICFPGTNKVVGTRRTLVFRQRKGSTHGLKTRWFMHRYQLLHPGGIFRCPSQMLLPDNVAVEDWVVYCVFQEKRRPKTNKAIQDSFIHQNYCSSCSSVITEDSSNAMDQEASSAYRGSSCYPSI